MKQTLNTDQIACLRYIEEHGPCTLGDLGGVDDYWIRLSTMLTVDRYLIGYTEKNNPLYLIKLSQQGRDALAANTPKEADSE